MRNHLDGIPVLCNSLVSTVRVFLFSLCRPHLTDALAHPRLTSVLHGIGEILVAQLFVVTLERRQCFSEQTGVVA